MSCLFFYFLEGCAAYSADTSVAQEARSAHVHYYTNHSLDFERSFSTGTC